MTMTPSVGRIVHVFPGENTQWHFNVNGPDDPIAAIITRAWDDNLINVMAFPDANAAISITSVNRLHSAPAMRWDWPQIVQSAVPTGRPLS